MKIMLEQAALAEPEVCIRGELASPQVTALIAALQRVGGLGKIFLYRDEREYPFDPGEISFFEARGSKVYARCGGEEYETRLKLYELCERWPVKASCRSAKVWWPMWIPSVA